jgi:hypothetical protein
MQGLLPGSALACWMLAAGLGIAAHPARVAAATYYVDFAQGSDLASGLSPDQAWKRAPGDSRAGEVPRRTRLAPGDSLLFRSGVPYRGTVVVRHAGTADAPIRYIGDGWGPGRAELDGSEPLELPRPCRSADDCGGAEGWATLYRARLPEGTHAVDGLFQGDRPLDLPAGDQPLQPGSARLLAGTKGRVLVLNPLPETPFRFARGAARVGFLLLAGGNVEIRGFSLARFTPAPRRGPYAGNPLVQLQPLDGIRLAGLQAGGTSHVRLLVAAPPVRAIAGVSSGPT